jgi:SnoaL-like domain
VSWSWVGGADLFTVEAAPLTPEEVRTVSTTTDLQEVIDGLARRLDILEAEGAIRQLIADHQWVSDSGSTGSGIPDWSTALPEEPEEPQGRAAHWASGGMWEGSGLSRNFAGFTHGDEGPDAAPATAPPRTSWLPRMMHFMTNERIRVESVTSATGRWYSWEAATARLGEGYEAIWIAGRYECEFIKVGDHWKIKTQRFQEVFSIPVDSKGWIESAHVAYGPANAI